MKHLAMLYCLHIVSILSIRVMAKVLYIFTALAKELCICVQIKMTRLDVTLH